ncbi:MAG: 3'(2'),5'-bisphosphate nucleotidase CysQ [Gemmatimonadota bacterium]
MISSRIPLDPLVDLTRSAGNEILRWYGNHGTVEEKEDRSPLTAADRAAHEHLLAGLADLTPGIPVLSEESPADEIAERLSWERFWLVDPLDGTKEFLKGTGEFTVNVALIEGGRPRIGVVHVPATGRTYRAAPDLGAQVTSTEGGWESIRARSFQADSPVLVASRDHAGPMVEALAAALGPGVEFTSMGSSLKFCLVAEGRADLYLRDRPTMEWDTGAAQCVVEYAGGIVVSLDEGTWGAPLGYNKSSLRNPGFLCIGDPEGPWEDLVHRTGHGN